MNTKIIKTKEEWIEFLRIVRESHNCYIPMYAREEHASNFPGLVIWRTQDNPNHIDDFYYEIINQFGIQEIYDEIFGFISQQKGVPN